MKRTSIKQHLTTGIAISALLLSTPGFATTNSQNEMFIIEGFRSSSPILTGQYDKAISRIKNEGRFLNPYGKAALKNNLCVALVKSGELEEAIPVCESATTMAQSLKSARSPANGFSRRGYLQLIDITITNLNVATKLAREKSLVESNA